MPNELPGVFELIGTGWRSYKERLNVYLQMGALVFLVATILPALGTVAGVGFMGSASVSSLVTGAAFLGVVYFVLMVWVTFAYLHLVRGHGESLSIKDAFRRAWGQLLSFMWLGIAVSFIFVGAVLLVAGVPALVLGSLGSWVAAGVYGAAAAVVVVVLFGTWSSFSNWLLIDSGYRGVGVYAASRDLVRKAGFWAVFWRVLALSFIIGFLSAVLQSLGGKDNLIMGGIADFVLYTVFWPVFFGALFAFYRAARAKAGEPQPRDKKWFSGIAIAGIVLIVALPLVGGYVLLSKLGPLLDTLQNGLPTGTLDLGPIDASP